MFRDRRWNGGVQLAAVYDAATRTDSVEIVEELGGARRIAVRVWIARTGDVHDTGRAGSAGRGGYTAWLLSDNSVGHGIITQVPLSRHATHIPESKDDKGNKDGSNTDANTDG